MPATREQLLARWETTEGRQLAEMVVQALDGGQTTRYWKIQNGLRALEPTLLKQIALLPFADEVKPAVDLRGLHWHKKNSHLALKYLDLSHVRLDYAFLIDRIIECRTDGAIFDGCRSIQGMFSDTKVTGISCREASLNGGSFGRAHLSASNFQHSQLIKADLSYAICLETNFEGADLRFTDLRYANLSGADLRGADLTESRLHGVILNEQTRLERANFSGAHLPDDVRAFAERSGAVVTPRPTYHMKMMVEMEATARALQQRNTDGRYDDAIVAVNEARELFRKHPDYTYSDGMDEAFARFGSPPSWKEEVLEIWDDASKALAYYL